MKNNIFVRLEDDTCGTIKRSSDASIGDTVEVKLLDENGNFIYKAGKIEEFLEDYVDDSDEIEAIIHVSGE